ncbi:MAG: ABC transporter ATP-binding protein [Saccharolobus sp.]|jgi:peptide/nickel transport system ATP-binding protein|uniref:ABC transporter ATP-binding protein n=1 Tax=Saccharolobus sp. TaxID=2100761 RepID=UPI0028CBEAA2|nr:ABC transporter ATP-binding protein [Saccharolobus sp.]MDT7861346.1 ABC transporter ATP-binding protein [Saccharolobus sp.]
MLLEIRNLNVYYNTILGWTKVLSDINLDVERGEIVGIVGESGSGKSTLGHAIARILPPNGKIQGDIIIDGVNLAKLKDSELQKYRGTWVFMIFQNPLNSLNPVKKVGFQLVEAAKIRHQREGKKVNERDLINEVIQVLKDLRLPDPQSIIDRYPHQLSGGQVQRIVIAMSLLLKPKLLIADEPTSALDVTIQAQVINLFKQLNKELNTSILFITHDISLAYVIADRIIVMYAGRIMEDGKVEEVLKSPMHPYSQGLVSSIPTGDKNNNKLPAIPGNPPSFFALPTGCKFHPRCSKVMNICKEKEPDLINKNGRRVRCWLYE